VSFDLTLRMGPFLARVRSELPETQEHFARLYSDYERASGDGHFDVAVVGGGGARRWLRRQAFLVANGFRPFLPLPAGLSGPLVEWGLNWCIGRRTHRWVVLHAAVLERGGRALLLPAQPGAGKSTLCAALAYSGWRFFSDEFALIDPDTHVITPVPRPISLKEASIEIIRRRHPDVVYTRENYDVEKARFVHARPPADSVRRAHETAVPGWIVLPRYVAGSRTTLEAMPRARALMELADQSFNYNYLGIRGFRALEHVVRRSQCYRLEYSDLDDVLPRLARLTAG
jgi:HprK-related kinase A